MVFVHILHFHSSYHTIFFPNFSNRSIIMAFAFRLYNQTVYIGYEPWTSEPWTPERYFSNKSQTYISWRVGIGQNVLSEEFNSKKEVYSIAISAGKIINNTFDICHLIIEISLKILYWIYWVSLSIYDIIFLIGLALLILPIFIKYIGVVLLKYWKCKTAREIRSCFIS